MTKLSRIATISIFTAATYSSTFAQATTSNTAYDLAALPIEVAARVEHLAQFGDRFETVIRQIIAETAKPDWGWNTCDQSDATSTLLLPES